MNDTRPTVMTQWRVLECGSPRTGWYEAGHESERAWRVLANANPGTYAMETRDLIVRDTTEASDAAVARAQVRKLKEENASLDWRARSAEAERDQLREAMKPFADLAEAYDPPDGDDDHTLWDQTQMPTVGMLRDARDAYRPAQD
jgi:hypothetical protein